MSPMCVLYCEVVSASAEMRISQSSCGAERSLHARYVMHLAKASSTVHQRWRVCVSHYDFMKIFSPQMQALMLCRNNALCFIAQLGY